MSGELEALKSERDSAAEVTAARQAGSDRGPLKGGKAVPSIVSLTIAEADNLITALERGQRIEAEWVAWMYVYEAETTPDWRRRPEFATLLAALESKP